jgi:hypothetical protein
LGVLGQYLPHFSSHAPDLPSWHVDAPSRAVECVNAANALDIGYVVECVINVRLEHLTGFELEVALAGVKVGAERLRDVFIVLVVEKQSTEVHVPTSDVDNAERAKRLNAAWERDRAHPNAQTHSTIIETVAPDRSDRQRGRHDGTHTASNSVIVMKVAHMSQGAKIAKSS